jgi:SAM-dependent methyltransferase
LAIDFPDCTYDFVHCGGVLHHSADPLLGLKELARVTKKGGMLYIHIYGSGGLIRDITTLLRDKYKNDESFQILVDGLTASKLRGWLTFLFSKMDGKDDLLGSLASRLDLEELIDEDLALTIKDRIQAPVYFEHSEDEIRDCLDKEGFSEIERLTRYPKFTNIRRFLSPLYEDYSCDLAKILYGNGYIQLKAIKA